MFVTFSLRGDLDDVVLLYSETGTGKQRDNQLWDDHADHDLLKRGSLDVDTPLLVIGTKQDLAQDRGDGSGSLPVRTQRKSYVAEEFGAEEIHLNSTDGKGLVPGSSASNKLARFFDKVIERQFYRRDGSGGSAGVGGGGGGVGGVKSGSWDSGERRRLI